MARADIGTTTLLGKRATVLDGVFILLALLLLASAAVAMRGFVVADVERGRTLPWTTTRHAVLARETVARVLFGLSRPFGRAVSRAHAGDGVPVVLVSDPSVGVAALALLRTFLYRRGLPVVPVAFPSHDQPLADRAEHLDGVVRAACERAGLARVDVVAFGHGGLVAAWWLAHGGGAARVHRLVTLGTPWRGTRMAVFLHGSLAVEARPGSHDLDGLVPPPVPTLAVWCPEDPEVVPAEHGYAQIDRSVAVEGAGHLGLLLSARAFRAVLAGLREPLPEPA